ncbi:hypothetical protein CL689_04805 [Candidatus Saccharibacteria bacterium]|nr:hypothetical protein [Candidatus Saccharibacteria bacterium]MBJ58506.1 hypothetical protein [Candidatus Saccharibacteria bacterium]MBQ69360.1 hypothetical protein [Candidatus Saccharibacteria bacterium]|tara:strand:+ start:266 stop:919 length:654 start_codon:yes stop_codon:yes gene_type:complete
MKNKIFITVIVVLAIAAAAVWYFVVFSVKPVPEGALKTSNTTVDEKKQKPASDNIYANLKGDAFDEAYIADMLAHHEGALNMSEQAMAVTAHEEIRTLASNIVQSQSAELMKMRTWQKEWGYKETMSGGHGSHGGAGMDMGGDMVEMQNKLQGLTGEEYDKEFLKQMIVHHEQAVEMSKYAADNAKHQEVKDLASAVISAQTTEINQMKQWQKQWGY